MKQIIKDVLNDMSEGQINLSCEVRLELDEEKRKKDWYEDAGDGHLLKVDDLDKMKMKLSEDIVDSKDEGYIYESPDGGETIFKRKVGGSKRELVKNWEKISR
mgnify:CR=1 FL=1